MQSHIATERSRSVDKSALEQRVKETYAQVALNPFGQFHFEMGRPLAKRLGYPDEALDAVPTEALDSFAGVGYYFHLAAIQEGEFVVDLGSGSGTDAFIAAMQTGSTGKVIGVDMTAEQLQKAYALKKRFGFRHMHFRKSYIEEVPLPDEIADVVVSNGVFNLSADKLRVFREVSRLLKPGGRMVIADIVCGKELPEHISCDADLWAGCIGGAVTMATYSEMIARAGMKLEVTEDNPQYVFLSKSAQRATEKYGIKSTTLVAKKPK